MGCGGTLGPPPPGTTTSERDVPTPWAASDTAGSSESLRLRAELGISGMDAQQPCAGLATDKQSNKCVNNSQYRLMSARWALETLLNAERHARKQLADTTERAY
jgi:hypothetical protein